MIIDACINELYQNITIIMQLKYTIEWFGRFQFTKFASLYPEASPRKIDFLFGNWNHLINFLNLLY